MIHNLRDLVNRAKYIIQQEGFTEFMRRSVAFVRKRFFLYGNYYLYEHVIGEKFENDFLPDLHDFTFKIISSNKEADQLANATGYDFRKYIVNARRNLDKGAIAFCIFVDGEIAHIGWIALNKEAKDILNPLPYKVDFANNEACTAGAETVPKYRRKGLMTYGYGKRQQYLKDMNITKSRSAVRSGNTASQRVHAKFNTGIYARARYLKFIGWEFYKETPTANDGCGD
jgi:RimJ/RimL family protein N-acetyltransferase